MNLIKIKNYFILKNYLIATFIIINIIRKLSNISLNKKNIN